MSEMSKVAIIPARGGSVRLPRKNVIDFLGRPIIAFTIEAALECALFDRVIVSTDDDEIEEVARGFGAEISRRPAELATAEARVSDVCVALLDEEEAAGRQYDILTVLYATAPLRTAEDIRGTTNLAEGDDCDYAMGVTELTMGIHQSMRLTTNGTLVPVFPDLVRSRSAVVEPYFLDNGSTYAVKIKAFRKFSAWYGTPLRGYSMPAERSVDIDTFEDFELARFYGERAKL